ncbi:MULTISPECIES: ComEC/Rec2 family competence protein [unclassified Aureimonas]|uniref:ComEC/Rec2 family competence protein n=1 Tax=unclassified Aureimonas TaxID=2615206 RepID=UPI0012E37ED7|nr:MULTISPECIES: ComEC/Rec2 family competence protein [unclassified Aureimonas]
MRVRRLRRRVSALRRPTLADLAEGWADALEAEAKARSAFFLIPIGLMIGIAITDGAGFRMGLPPALAIALPMLAWARHLGGRGLLGAFVLVLAFTFAGMVLALGELALTKTTTFSGEATVRIDGRVAWRDRDERERMRYLVRIEETERPQLSHPPEIASILVSSRHEPIPVGGRFEGLVRLRAPSGPAYPGAYDFAFAPYFQGRGANGFALGPPEPVEASTIEATLGERLVRLRLAMSDRIRAVIGGGAGAVASALITGERSGIPDDINDWLRATGLSHVLSISGLHMALVAGFAMVLVRGLLAAIPSVALTWPTKKIAAVAALLVATAYLVISGSDVATDRSYVMLSIMLAAILVDRPALTLRNVAIAAIVVMLTTPHAVVTASFQMSFSATAALVGVYGAFSRHRAQSSGGRRERHAAIAILVFLLGLAASSTIAGLATAPYAAYHFQRIAPYGVIANLIAVPIFSFWIMPLALIAALAMPFGLDAPFLILIGWALDLVFAMAEVLASHLPDAPSGRLTTTGLLVVTAALLLACLSASRLRWGAAPLAALGLILLPERGAPPDLLVYEDGRELALIDAAGDLQPLRRRPNDFVFDQWFRAFSNQTPLDRKPVTEVRSAVSDPGERAPRPDRLEASNASTQGAEPSQAVQLAKDLEKPSQTSELEPRLSSASIEGELVQQEENGSSGDSPSMTAGFTCEPSPIPDEERGMSRLKSERAGTGVRDASATLAPAVSSEMSPPVSTDGNQTPDTEPKTATSLTSRLGSEHRTSNGADVNSRLTDSLETSPDAASSSAQVIHRRSGKASRSGSAPTRKPPPPRQICRATTRSGLRVAWTDDYRLLGTVCDTADIAIVARAVARRECRSGARLVTLRTLRETGSLAISRDAESGRPVIEVSIKDPDEPWNLHRKAAWPEHWKNPNREAEPARPPEPGPSLQTR